MYLKAVGKTSVKLTKVAVVPLSALWTVIIQITLVLIKYWLLSLVFVVDKSTLPEIRKVVKLLMCL